MKKSYQKISVLMVCFLLLLSVVGTALAVEEETVSEEFLRNQDVANEAYTKMMQEFAENGSGELGSWYPEYYAGSYINAEGNLVIKVKNASEQDLAYIRESCACDNIIMENASYSYNELLSVITDIKEVQGDNVVATGIKDDQNIAYVGVKEIERCSISTYGARQMGTSLPVEFYEDNGMDETVSAQADRNIMPRLAPHVKPGYYIYANGPGSVGFYGYIVSNGTKKYGFFTAGHVASQVGTMVELMDGSEVGECIKTQNSGSVDLAFIEMTGYGAQFTNKVNQYTVKAGTYILPAVGSLVYKTGYTTKITEGHIVKTSSGEVDGFYDLIVMDKMTDSGDSGGLVYTIASDYQIKVVGLVKGSSTTADISYATSGFEFPWGAYPSDPPSGAQ